MGYWGEWGEVAFERNRVVSHSRYAIGRDSSVKVSYNKRHLKFDARLL
jgi:hypothetical protein